MNQLERFQAIENAIQQSEEHKRKLAHLRDFEATTCSQISSTKTMLMAIELHMKQLREGKTPTPIDEIFLELTQ